MEENLNVKNEKGSITMFVLVGLLFMTSFLLISIGSNINKSKMAKEQFNIMSNIYSRGDGDENAYNRAYTALRKEKKQTLTTTAENTSTLEINKGYEGKLENLIIYGNSIQEGEPSTTNPSEIQSVGDLITDTSDENYGKYKVQIKATDANATTQNIISIYITAQLEKTDSYVDYIDFEEKKVIRKETTGETSTIEELSIIDYINMYEDYTKIEILTEIVPSKIEATYEGYTFE